jgi:hypothetical protein
VNVHRLSCKALTLYLDHRAVFGYRLAAQRVVESSLLWVGGPVRVSVELQQIAGAEGATV